MEFREKKDYELDRLSDEELIAYLVRARRAGDDHAANTALAVFAHRHFDDLVASALLKLESRDDAEDVAGQTIADVIRTAFQGEVVAEAMGLLYRILRRRIADFYRAREGKPLAEPLPEDLDDEERKRGDVAIEPDATGRVDLLDVIENLFAARSPAHCMVIDDFVFDGYNGQETAARVNNAFGELDPPMTEANVHQIAKRFRTELRGELDRLS